ncbi:MAG: hypothetical protein ABIK68_09990, partial [bacterium]
FTEKFFDAIPNLPEENKLWISDWKKFNKQGLATFKQTLNTMTDTSVAEKTPQGYLRASLDSLGNQVEQLFEQVSQVREQGEKYLDKITEQIPEPGKQWARQWTQATGNGIDELKTVISKNIKLTSQFAGAGVGSSSTPVKPEPAKPQAANKTAAKTGNK